MGLHVFRVGLHISCIFSLTVICLAHCKHDFQGNTMMVYAILRQAEAGASAEAPWHLAFSD